MEVPGLVVSSITPEQWMSRWESRGVVELGCSDPELLSRYKRGKAMRDWWFKEKGELSRLGSWFMPEEFLGFLMPECFCELFGRWPITCIVRSLYDEHYSDDEYKSDMHHREMGFDHERDGYRCFRV